jgi:hypothetical protein
VLGLMGIATDVAAVVRAADPNRSACFGPRCSGGGLGCAAHSRGQSWPNATRRIAAELPRSHVASPRSAWPYADVGLCPGSVAAVEAQSPDDEDVESNDEQ